MRLLDDIVILAVSLKNMNRTLAILKYELLVRSKHL